MPESVVLIVTFGANTRELSVVDVEYELFDIPDISALFAKIAEALEIVFDKPAEEALANSNAL